MRATNTYISTSNPDLSLPSSKMTESQLTTALTNAMKRHLTHDISSAVIQIGDDVRRLVSDEDHAGGTVLYTDTSSTMASIEDPDGFMGDRLGAWDLQEAWDKVAEDLGGQIGKEVSADLFEIPQVVLLVEEE